MPLSTHSLHFLTCCSSRRMPPTTITTSMQLTSCSSGVLKETRKSCYPARHEEDASAPTRSRFSEKCNRFFGLNSPDSPHPVSLPFLGFIQRGAAGGG
jgi:hypothetical protein